MGRPVKYTKELLAELAEKLDEWCKDDTHWWLKDYALENGMHWAQLCQLARKSKEFSFALKRAHMWQEAKLVKMGMNKDNSAAMAIFALKNVAAWRDRQDIMQEVRAFEFILPKKAIDEKNDPSGNI